MSRTTKSNFKLEKSNILQRSSAAIRLIAATMVAATLGACSKCDVPTLIPNQTPGSCHDGPATQ